jgi:hypothetical protein
MCRYKKCVCLVSLVFLLGVGSNDWAAVTYNQYSGPANGDWNTAGNWALGHVPTTAEKAGFKTVGGPLVVTSTPACGEWTLGGTTGGIVTINSGGTVQTVVGSGTGRVSMGQSASESGTLNMNGGTATFAGILDVGYAGTGIINLDGGTISAANFAMRSSGGVGTMNITAGTLIIDGDKTSLINGYIASGWITAYGGSGTVNVSYNTPNAGKTTVTGTSGGGPPGKATTPNPANGATGVSATNDLSWTAGSGATSHDVYFGTTSPGTFRGNQTATTYDTGTMAYSTTYYWRIDEKNANGTTTGDVWSFTTSAGTAPTVYPYLTFRSSPTNSIVVNWSNQDAAGDSSVDYGPTSSYGSTVHFTAVTNYHHVELTGLNSGATYHYRIRSSDGTVGADNTFTTAAANTTSFSFAVYGDCRGAQSQNEPYYTRHQALCNWLAPQNFAFILTTGDTVWEGASTASLSTYWPDFFYLESNLSKGTVLMTTLGNHEVQPTSVGTPEERYTNYKNFYMDGYPINGTSGNEGRVYSFNYGNAHIVCLDSFQISLTTQATWLDADLAAANADPSIQWIFAFMHSPMYTTSSTHSPDTDEQAAFGALFDQYHVDIVFAGHNHVYERSKSIKAGAVVPDGQGTVYITNGLGGANFDPISSDPLFVTEYNSQTLATCVTINGSQLTINSITNADSIVRDSFTLGSGTQPPGKATSPSPANGATGVSTTNDLSWTAGSGATSHDVYFGTSSPGTFRGNQTATTFNTGTMANSTTYYWRIDEKNANGTTTGDVWSFTTAAASGGLPWSDNFESGNFTSGGWTTSGSTSVTTAAKYTGTYGAKIAGVAWIEKALSTVGYNTIHVKYWRKTAGYESNEALKVEWWNGSAWTEIDSSRSTAWTSKDITCASGANNNANFKVRFRSTGNDAATEYGYVDDVQITGTAQ